MLEDHYPAQCRHLDVSRSSCAGNGLETVIEDTTRRKDMDTWPTTPLDLASALPDVTTTLRMNKLDSPIDIYRDRYGIPHVKTQSTHDAFFGQGFVTAQDRLWQMDVNRRRAYGRWAELVGESGLEKDIMMRKFQIEPTVKRDYDCVNAETRSMLDAYAAGVNAFINSTDSLPIEYLLLKAAPELWQPWDALAVFKGGFILMGTFEAKLWRAKLVSRLGPEKAARLLSGDQPGHLVIVPPGHVYDGGTLNALEGFNQGLDAIAWLHETPAVGSNNWAISGRRTASGKPLVAGDPHRGLETPNTYYQNHVTGPEFDAIGLSFPGVPGFPHFGHNGYVAWCVTHAQSDYQDLYIERFNPDHPTQYAFQGEWKQADVRCERIHVRDGEPVDLQVTATHHGPVIGGDPATGRAVTLRYTATAAPNHGFESISSMMRATSVAVLDEAMRPWVDPCNNVISADVHGTIAYLHRGQVPMRAMANAWLPVPGWTGQHEWQGEIPFEDWARSCNPETGFIVSANNRIIGRDYPYYLSLDTAPEYRARRIVERLQPLTCATVQDMSAIHADHISIPAHAYLKWIGKIDPSDALSAQAKTILLEWDGAMHHDEIAPTIYSAWRGRLLQIVIRALLGEGLAHEMFSASGRGAPIHMQHLATRIDTAAKENDHTLLPEGYDWQSITARALSEALSELKTQFGDEMTLWKWGNLHRTRPQHLLSPLFPEVSSHLDPPSMSLGGDFDTPLAGAYTPGGPYHITGTSVARYVFDTSNWDLSCWIVPLGASGHPGSPHYADQASIWAQVNLIPMTYSWATIQVEAATHQVLKPS